MKIVLSAPRAVPVAGVGCAGGSTRRFAAELRRLEQVGTLSSFLGRKGQVVPQVSLSCKEEKERSAFSHEELLMWRSSNGGFCMCRREVSWKAAVPDVRAQSL